MGIAQMKYINVYGPEKELQHTLSSIARCECFAPEQGEAIHSAIRFGTNRYEPLLTKAKGLLKDLGHSTLAADYIGTVDAYKRTDVADYLEKFAAEVARRSKRRTDIESELELYVKTDDLISHMQDLDINIEELFTVSYLKVRIGRIPKSSYIRLAYYADKGFNFTNYFNFTVYDFDGEYYWGMYFAPDGAAQDIDDIFKSLYFERIWVPEFVHGTPQEALQAIRQHEEELRAELAGITTPAGIVTEAELKEINDMAAWLHFRNQLYQMKKYALVFDHTFYISGFVPQDDMVHFEQTINDIPEVKIKEASKKQKLPVKPPVKLKNNAFVRPYQMFTEMYGLPSYRDMDPTAIVCVLYSVLYGLMFADVGQGLVLGLVGYFIMYRKMGLAIGNIISRCAIFSVLFGFLFGSVFGFEHLLDPVFNAMGFAEKPFDVLASSSITTILIGAIAIGVVVVTLAIILGIASKLRRGKRGEAFTSPNGVAGLVFYVALIGLALDKLVLNIGFSGNILYLVCLIILPIVVMYLAEPLAEMIDGHGFKLHNPGEYLVSSFFEMFVSMLEYLSNTLSFLRVGGFVLVHAGMMSVVETLAHFAGGASPVVWIIGNIFVTCLEGLIVGIQALRLNYYELFSRFYETEGVAFEPLRIQSDTVEL